jgi:hypothetical protein
MSENNFEILAATPTPTATPVVGMTNLTAELMGQYCFYDTLNGKPSYKHKDVESYIYWKQGFWNIGVDRSLKGYVAVSSSLSEPPSTNWINVVGSVNFAGAPRPGFADPGSLSDLTVISMSKCPATPTATPPGFTYPPTSTPTVTPTPTATDIGPSPTPTGTPGSSPTPTPTTHIPEGYLVSGTPLDLKCCGSTGGGGEIHMFWDGFNNPDIAYDAGSGTGSYIMFDDNVIRTAQVTDSEGSKIDHYAIEWIEIHQDDSVHAILSERKQICHFPISTIITGFRTIGSPLAASVAQSCSPQKKVECGTCKYNESWCLFRINYKQPKFRKLKRFGGLNWEAMKYISGLSITGSGANGPIGAGISFYNGPYFRPLTPDITGAYNESALDSGNGMDVFGQIISNSIQIDNLKRAGQYDIKNTISARIALLPQPNTGGSSDPCCSATDLEFTKGNCPKDPTNDWWIVPDCNCDRFTEDPGYGAGGPFGTELECYRNTTCGSSFRCVDGECSETYYGYYPTIEDCVVNCPFPRPTPPPPTSPPPTSPPTVYAFKCESGTCIDCEENPSSCTDKDCVNDPKYYCSTNKMMASQNCEDNCDSDPPVTPTATPAPQLRWRFWYCNGDQVVCEQSGGSGTIADSESECVAFYEGVCTPPPTETPPPKWYFDGCSGGQANCIQGTPPSSFYALYNSQSECQNDHASQCVSDCGHCTYSYHFDMNEWQLSSDNCGGGCYCPSKSYINSHNGNSGGCDGEPTCTSCSAPCTPYSNFMYMSETNEIEY